MVGRGGGSGRGGGAGHNAARPQLWCGGCGPVGGGTVGRESECGGADGVEAGGDLAERAAIHAKHYPTDEFEAHCPFFMDDEDDVTEEQLLQQYNYRDHVTEQDFRDHALKESTRLVGESLMGAIQGSGSQVGSQTDSMVGKEGNGDAETKESMPDDPDGKLEQGGSAVQAGGE